MTNVNRSLQVVLTGDRLDEYEQCREILVSLGVDNAGLSTQHVMSAALQTMLAHHKVGGKVDYRFNDGRYGRRRAK